MDPKFVHDGRECCVFLGPYVDGKGRYDLYFCTQGGRLPTVIARYGDEGPEYTSGLGSTQGPLFVAANRAVRQGLLKRVDDRLVLA